MNEKNCRSIDDCHCPRALFSDLDGLSMKHMLLKRTKDNTFSFSAMFEAFSLPPLLRVWASTALLPACWVYYVFLSSTKL